MDWSRSQVITQGPSAGMPRPLNDIVMDQMKAIWRLTISLKANGFQVLASDTNACSIPSIHVLPGPKTAEMIACGRAVYYRYSMSADGVKRRHGQFNVNGVRVIWIEQDNTTGEGHATTDL